MINTDTAYIAALLDSIGAIKIEPPKKGEECSLYVWITRKDFQLMELLQKAGAYVIHLPDGQFRAKWKDKKAYYLLKSIIPFSREKKEQIKVGIEFMEAKTSEQKENTFAIPYILRLKMLKSEN